LHIGEKIRIMRLKKNMTQKDLAEGLVTPSMISQIESGTARPTPQLLEKLRQRLGFHALHSMERTMLEYQCEMLGLEGQIHAGEIEEAEQWLGALGMECVDGLIFVQHQYLRALIWMRKENFLDAFNLLNDVYFSEDIEPKRKVEAYLARAECAMQLRMVEWAANDSEAAYRLAERYDFKDLAARCAILKGGLHERAGQKQDAMAWYERGLALRKETVSAYDFQEVGTGIRASWGRSLAEMKAYGATDHPIAEGPPGGCGLDGNTPELLRYYESEVVRRWTENDGAGARQGFARGAGFCDTLPLQMVFMYHVCEHLQQIGAYGFMLECAETLWANPLTRLEGTGRPPIAGALAFYLSDAAHRLKFPDSRLQVLLEVLGYPTGRTRIQQDKPVQ
jgi:transcriptional regulator with XRE-family HTH domain